MMNGNNPLKIVHALTIEKNEMKVGYFKLIRFFYHVCKTHNIRTAWGFTKYAWACGRVMKNKKR